MINRKIKLEILDITKTAMSIGVPLESITEIVTEAKKDETTFMDVVRTRILELTIKMSGHES